MEILTKTVITKVSECIIVPSDKNHNFTMTDRPCYGLSFCEYGNITYTHNGKVYTSDPDHAVILPKGQTYHVQGNKKGLFYVINFDCADTLCDTILTIPIQNSETFMQDFEQIKTLLLFEKNRAKVMSVFYNVLHKLSQNKSPNSNVLLPAIKYLEKNCFSQDISNEVLAQKCNLSEVYFRKLFSKIYGVTPKQYILDIRINKAKQLLTEGIIKVSSISEECGFTNQYHFSRIFKLKTGLTPTDYMRQNKIFKI